MADGPAIGVIIVAFESAAIIGECLDSLFASDGVSLRVVVVDNNSDDDTCDRVRHWATGAGRCAPAPDGPLPPDPRDGRMVEFVEGEVGQPLPLAPLTLLRSRVNGGYGHAVNRGLERLLGEAGLNLFWILNPDCVVPRATARILADAGRSGPFSLMGGRTIYYDLPDEVQTDGGGVSRWTGRCRSLNGGCDPSTTPVPPADTIDYVTGASMVASRAFVNQAGLMAEDYFLYYEEVDWAYRRGDLPLRVVPEAIVYHRGGTTIGTGSTVRRASPFANYFNFRNRVRFVRRFMPWSLPFTIAFALAKALQLMLKGGSDEAAAILAGSFGRRPPAGVARRVSDPAAAALAFGR